MKLISRVLRALGALSLAGCAGAYSYRRLSPPEGTSLQDSVRAAARVAIIKPGSPGHWLEVPDRAYLNRVVRKCSDERGTNGCHGIGDKTILVFDSVIVTNSDTAYARVSYYVSELTPPELAFTKETYRAIRSPSGAWTATIFGSVTTGR